MITINIIGGLGNQLFQVFCLLNYGMKYKKQIGFPIFKPDLISPVDNKSKRPTYWDTLLYKLKPFLLKNEPIAKTYMEPGFRYYQMDNNNVTDFKLSGYFQSYKYFEENYEAILKLLEFDNKRNLVREKYKKYLNNTTALHFRIGDYKNNTKFHPIMKIDYYIKSINHILTNGNVIENILFFNEVDDETIVDNNINKLNEVFPDIIFTRCEYNIEDWEQMLLMSCCSHNIIANSTFSWWGAYLNINIEKIVCYPSIWFGNNTNVNDLFPEKWNKIIC